MQQSDDFELVGVLGHPMRRALLRRLMAGQATLSQLGAYFNESAAHIRHHIKKLERAGLVELAELRPVQGGPEKYYRATREALFIHLALLPDSTGGRTPLIVGSMDYAMNQLGQHFEEQPVDFALSFAPLSSLDGLIALRQGLCQMTTSHLIDPHTGEYNRPFVRRLFPAQKMALMQAFRREGGLLLPPGNPLGIRSLEDLARPDVRMVNREPGSGVRQWLDAELKHLGIEPESLRGYDLTAHSHSDAAQYVRSGRADASIGIAAAAREFGLDFIPLLEEPYEIVLPAGLLNEARYSPFFEYLASGKFRAQVRAFNGYLAPQTAGTVEMIAG